MDKKKKKIHRKVDIYTGKDDLHLSPRGERQGKDLLLGCQKKTETSPLIKDEFYSHQYYDNPNNKSVGDVDEEDEDEESSTDTEDESAILNTTTTSFDEDDDKEAQDSFVDSIPSIELWRSRRTPPPPPSNFTTIVGGPRLGSSRISRYRSDESRITRAQSDESGSSSGTSKRRRRHIKGGPSSSCGRGWMLVKHHLRNGSFLLLPESIHNENYQVSKKSQKSVRQALIDEFHEGMTFSIPSCLCAILIYLIVSIVIFHFILEPDWTAIDSCYFAVTTFTTLGYGDLTPSNRASMIFTCIYSFTGVAILGVMLGVLGNRVIEKHDVMVGQVEDANRDQIMTMLGTSQTGRRCSYDEYFHDQSWLANPIRNSYGRANPMTERSVLQWRCGDGLYKNKTNSFFILIIVVVILTMTIAIREGWDGASAIYYFVITSCTIGYGDRVPEEQWERLLAVIYIPLAVVIMGNWLGFIAGTIMEHQASNFRKSTMDRRELTQEDLDAMDANGNGKVSWAEFLEFTLVVMKRVDYELIDELQSYFRQMDVTFSGELSRDDLVECSRRKLKGARRKLDLAAYKRKLINQGNFGHRHPAPPKHMLGKLVQTTIQFFSSHHEKEKYHPSERLPMNRAPQPTNHASNRFRWST